MKMYLTAILFCFSLACERESGNTNEVLVPDDTESGLNKPEDDNSGNDENGDDDNNSGDQTGDESGGDESGGDNPVDEEDEGEGEGEGEDEVDSCPNANAVDPAISAHALDVYLDEEAMTYVIDFEKPEDRDLRVISLYVNGHEDVIPTFTNGFELIGTAYWMVSVDKPFSTQMNLPMTYGELSGVAVDVTANYEGPEGGMTMDAIPAKTCLMFTVIAFEPDQDPTFTTSTFFRSHVM